MMPSGNTSLEEEARQAYIHRLHSYQASSGKGRECWGRAQRWEEDFCPRRLCDSHAGGSLNRCPWVLAGSTEWPHPDSGWSEHKSPPNFLGGKGRDGFGLKMRDGGVWVT